jgi:tRNA threonylcarbamoyladenosine biosynthesis protein TsaB
MSYILQIDTAIHAAYISIAKNGIVIAQQSNEAQKDHGTFLHIAIQNMLQQMAMHIHEIDAIAISAGPGSYTGLRLAFATAKGLCFTLNKPLIAINTLEIMAATAKHFWIQAEHKTEVFFCPMIDARRMEVFSAVYNYSLNIVFEPAANVIDENYLQSTLVNQPIVFVGDGADKFKKIATNLNAIFVEHPYNNMVISDLAYKKYTKSVFENLATASPFYLKEFFTTAILYS